MWPSLVWAMMPDSNTWALVDVALRPRALLGWPGWFLALQGPSSTTSLVPCIEPLTGWPRIRKFLQSTVREHPLKKDSSIPKKQCQSTSTKSTRLCKSPYHTSVIRVVAPDETQLARKATEQKTCPCTLLRSARQRSTRRQSL